MERWAQVSSMLWKLLCSWKYASSRCLKIAQVTEASTQGASPRSEVFVLTTPFCRGGPCHQRVVQGVKGMRYGDLFCHSQQRRVCKAKKQAALKFLTDHFFLTKIYNHLDLSKRSWWVELMKATDLRKKKKKKLLWWEYQVPLACISAFSQDS